MSAPPFFSVITVTLNHIDGLRATRRSIAAQTCTDFEWCIIDGASNDGTVDFLHALDTDMAVWSSAPDRGIYDAMNTGISRARGRYIIFMNAGDCFAAADTLARIKAAVTAQEHLPDFIYGDALEGGRHKLAKPHTSITRGMFTHHQAILYRRDCIADLRYDLAYKIAADYKFTAQFLIRYTHALYIPAPLCVFEVGGVSQTNACAGRREQFNIRRDLKMGNMGANAALYVAQSIIWTLRSRVPRLYWALRALAQGGR